MKFSVLKLLVLMALGGAQAWAQAPTARISSIDLTTGVVTVTERIGTAGNVPSSVGDNLAGLTYVAGNAPLTGDNATSPASVALFALSARTIAGPDQAADFTGYGTIGAPLTTVETYSDVAHQLSLQAGIYSPGASSYSGLTWLTVPDTFSLPGPHNFYTIHHRASGDYFSVIVPATSGGSTVYDLKPMSAGGVLTDPSTTGYFALQYATGTVATGYGANSMYYLRTARAVDTYPLGHTVFGELVPALASAPADRFDLNTAVGSYGATGFTTLAFSASDLGGGVNQFYYLRQDSTGTGNTILGRLNPDLTSGVRTISDIANLGGVFNTLTLAVAATGPSSAWTTNPTLFTAGAPRAASAQSISFAAIPNHNVSSGIDLPFVITPTASSHRDLIVTVVSGNASVATGGTPNLIPSQLTFTVTTFEPGVVTLQARQIGDGGFTENWLRQSFTVLGPVTTQAIAVKALTAGTPAVAFTPVPVTAGTGTGAITYAISPALPAGLSFNTATGQITQLTPSVATGLATYTVTATDSAVPAASSSKTFTLIVNAALTATQVIATKSVTAGTPAVSFIPIAAADGTAPYSYAVSPVLSASLVMNATTGAITGTPGVAAPAVTYTVTVTDAVGAIASNTFDLTVTTGSVPVPPIITSAISAQGTVGVPFVAFQITATGSPTSYAAFALPLGLVLNTSTGRITGTPLRAGNSYVTLSATNSNATGTANFVISIIPAISTQPTGTTVASGGNATFSVVASSGGANPLTYQWRKDGVDLPGATNASLAVSNVQSGNVGFYSVAISSGGATTTTTPALLGMNFTGQISGSATLSAAAVHHPNGNIYDQVLLTGTSASVKANAGQTVRLSYVDLTNDIVQVELSGAGSLTISLENPSGPAAAVNYNQPGVLYMKGHAAMTITGADATTNLSIFSVGKSNAVDQSLFRTGVIYDGYADLALVAIATTDGHFNGVRTGNASYFRAKGMTGIYAPGVQLSGPVFASDIDAAGTANAVLVLGAVADARITGGDLFQDNGGSVEVSGITHLQFTAGTSSQGTLLPIEVNRGRLTTNGVDVTAQLAP